MAAEQESVPAPRLSRLATGLAIFAIGLLVAGAILVGWDVMMRWLLRKPQSWVSDIASLTYPIALACCIPAALESGHMIAIKFLGEALGPRTTQVLDTLGSLLMSVLMVLIAWKVSERAISDWSAGYKTVNIGLPLAPTWIVVSLMLAVSALVQLGLSWRDLKQLISSSRSAHG